MKHTLRLFTVLLLGPLASLHAADTPPMSPFQVTQQLLNSIHVTPKLIFDPFPAYAQKYLPFFAASGPRQMSVSKNPPQVERASPCPGALTKERSAAHTQGI